MLYLGPGGLFRGGGDGKRKSEKIVLCGIIGHLPLRGRCPKVKVNEYGNAKDEEKTINNAHLSQYLLFDRSH